MYLPSPLSGRLLDRYGSHVLAYLSGATLLLAGLLAAAMPDESMLGLAVALAVLGLGWNLGLVAGTAVTTEAVPLAIRARTQGSVDVCIGLAGAGAGLGSGLFMAAASYSTLAVSGGAVALAMVPIVAFGVQVPPATGEHAGVGLAAPVLEMEAPVV